MWIVRLALRRPFTFVVMAILIALLGGAAILTTPTDIFPYIDIPVVSVVWSFTGVTPDEMENRIVTVSERAMTTMVNDIEHIASQAYSGVSVTKVFFQPNVKVEPALSLIDRDHCERQPFQGRCRFGSDSLQESGRQSYLGR